MKKAILVLLVGLFWCNVGLAGVQQEYIDRHLSDRKLDLIEGIWLIDGTPNAIWKVGNSYIRQSLSKKNLNCNNRGRISRSGNNYFETSTSVKNNCKVIATCQMQYSYITEFAATVVANCRDGSSGTLDLIRMWPDDISSHNAKFGGSSSGDSQSAGISFTIKDKKEQCAAIGFKPNTEKFADCVLKLVELDVKRKVNDPSMASQSQANQQVANELKRQNNLRQSQFLMNLSQQLLTPSSPASNMTTCRWSGQFLNCW